MISKRLPTLVFVSLLVWQIALAQPGNDLVSRLDNAVTLIRDNRLPEAERQLSAILKSNLNQPDALNLLGAIRAKQGRLPEAEKLFARAVSANANLVSARANLVQVYLIQGKPQDAISELNQILRLEPTNEDAFNKLQRLLLTHKRVEEFVNLVEQAKATRTVPFSVLLSLGDIYLERKNADKAEENFRLALEQQSDDADAILGLAQVARLRGDAASALSHLDRAKKSTAKSAKTLHRFALVSWEAGRYEEANLALLEAVKLKSDEPAFYLALGLTWLKKPDFVEAEQAFRRALQLEPDNAQVQTQLGYALLLQGKYSAAREMLEKSLLKQPAALETAYYLGLVLQEEGEDQRAIELFKKTLQQSASNGEVHLALGRSYLNVKDYPRAQTELELAVKLKPDDPKAHYQLAVLYARLKDTQRSQEHMQIMQRLEEAAKSPGKTTP